MHELSLAQSLKQIISEKCGNYRVQSVRLEVGRLSGVVPDAFNFCTDTVLKDGFGKQLKLDISYIKARARCDCGREHEIEDLLQPCPFCGKYQREILNGTDIILKSIEFET